MSAVTIDAPNRSPQGMTQPKEKPPVRVVIVVDEALSIGHAANATALLAVTLGALVEGLPGADAIDADGGVHPGLIPIGVPVLKGSTEALSTTRERAARVAGVTVVDFLAQGRQTNDYDEYRAMVAATPAAELRYLGVALHGPRTAINKLVGNFSLLR